MAAFAVTGSATTLGAFVVRGLGGAPVVVGVSPQAPGALGGAGCVVSLCIGAGPLPPAGPVSSGSRPPALLRRPGPRLRARLGRSEPSDITATSERLGDLRQVLAAAEAGGVRRLVHLSSAVVYGAAADNAVPLSEDAPVRPDPAFGWAVELAEAERLVAEWRDRSPGRSAAVLRPALVVGAAESDSLVRALGGLAGPRVAGTDRPVQFVHAEDVASAIVTCATAPAPVDGPLNVAAEGWIAEGEAAALAGAVVPPPRVPARLVGPARRLLWLVGTGATPPGAEAYVTHPWVVAADRLRALGWTPAHTTEEALVETTECSALATLPPRRRQQILLLAATVLAAALVLTPLHLVKRALHRRR